jgi:hypothetical protein
MRFLRYIKHRANERSTWMLIGTGIAGAAALSAPWSYIAAIIGLIAALVPDADIGKPNT